MKEQCAFSGCSVGDRWGHALRVKLVHSSATEECTSFSLVAVAHVVIALQRDEWRGQGGRLTPKRGLLATSNTSPDQQGDGTNGDQTLRSI